MNTELEARIIVEILEIKELINDAIELEHPQHLINLYQGMVVNKTNNLKLLTSVELSDNSYNYSVKSKQFTT